ncbi:DUF4235 domain-containing protein [Streptomyces sp. NPDC006691]|uniref:DUF4235 domain-containing protein n=1 Tax=Streptomyces sp. NPDC006691 TaxID=3364757 RepID=UPI0036C2E230
MNAVKIAYKPVGLTLGILSGVLAERLFRRAWRLIDDDGETPGATDEDRTWQAVLLAAALQGAILAGVRAAVDRAGATATRRVTGTWPG